MKEYLLAVTITADTEYTDVYLKDPETMDLKKVAETLLDEVGEPAEVHLYAVTEKEDGRLETIYGEGDPLCGYRTKETGAIEYLRYSAYSGEYVTEKEYLKEYTLMAAEEEY